MYEFLFTGEYLYDSTPKIHNSYSSKDPHHKVGFLASRHSFSEKQAGTKFTKIEIAIDYGDADDNDDYLVISVTK